MARGRGRDYGKQPCFNLRDGGTCRFGARCRYAHDTTGDTNGNAQPARKREQEDTPESVIARNDYNNWKRKIKAAPVIFDLSGIRKLWEDALEVLDGSDEHLKQQLARDLDEDTFKGREHMGALLSLDTYGNGHTIFIDLAEAFLAVFTHNAMLDCLSVDTAVGGLYNYISGHNGSRALPFFRRIISSLLEQHLASGASQASKQAEKNIIALLIALRELVVREPRVRLNEDVPELVDRIENATNVLAIDKKSPTSAVLNNKILEVRGIIAQAHGRLGSGPDTKSRDVPGGVVSTAYPRDLVVPQGRHDNDKMDIGEISILPTVAEIRSDAKEFLPSTHPEQPHFLTDGVSRHLDTNFRLLRHDVFGELKDALSGLMGAVERDSSVLERQTINLGNLRAHCYPRAHVTYVAFTAKRGLEAQLTFPHPPKLRHKTRTERKSWWEASKQLEEGALLCFLFLDDQESSLLLLTASEKNTDPKNGFTLTSRDLEATIGTKLTANSPENINTLTRLNTQNTHGILIEIPGVILATFVPILENIQRMYRHNRMPFRSWIVPESPVSTNAETRRTVPPPLYTQKPGFSFSLDPILKQPAEKLLVKSTTAVDDPILNTKLREQTGLDDGQCKAFIAALTREFALIQGPPGTGKSYLGVQLMRVLLEAKVRANLGPIVVVCYTNHALDQFLEHIVGVGINKVIRIGGQSRSEILADHNLRVISKSEGKTRSEKYILAKAFQRREELEKTVKHCLGAIHDTKQTKSSSHIEKHLAKKYPRISRQFGKFDEDGWELASGKSRFDLWRQGGIHRQATHPRPSDSSIMLKASLGVHELDAQERSRLIDICNEQIREEKQDFLLDSIREYDQICHELRLVHDEGDRRVLQNADVIGVTTTGLAQRIEVLQKLHSKVVICEEAAEVLEAHIISALLPNIEHVIQIGDHQQLRPQINNFQLSLESQQGKLYQLDRSQFERLSIGEAGKTPFPLAQLNVQRRMRPEISTLIKSTMYPSLVDHLSVKALPDVVGLRQNVFWLDHKHYEEKADREHHQTSHSNLWEVEMVHALVRHLVRQGAYRSDEIAVLTPYTGQLQKLRIKLREDFEIVLSDRDEDELVKAGLNQDESQPRRLLERKQLSQMLRVATVDNFQGEEAKVVIVSLVRSNEERRVGFLKTQNRINVLLSRAQHGMYLFGNVQTYSSVEMWSRIIGMLRNADSVGTELGLCCPRHPDTSLQVSESEDFARISPEGGCQLICDRRLSDCGHRCRAKCHSEAIHQVFACPEPCARLHSPCNHACQKQTCGEACGPCLVPIDSVVLPCGHSQDNVACHLTRDTSKIYCPVKVRKEVPRCKHIVEVPCSLDVSSERYRCLTSCEEILPCGHQCPGTCANCRQQKNEEKPTFMHKSCKKICGRRFGTCNHDCPKSCHDGKACGPCLTRCEVRCAHSRCTLECNKPCAPCVEDCAWSCQHRGRCKLPCSAPCDRLPCNKRCSNQLDCGHQCPGLCGETCPEQLCQSCGKGLDSRVDLLEMKTYAEIDLDESPIVVLACRHFFTAETLDGLVGMTDVYEQDGYGNFTGLKDISGTLALSIPRCPDCQSPIRQYATQRYNRLINRAVIDEMTKRYLVSGKDQLRELERRIDELETSLTASRGGVKKLVSPLGREVTPRMLDAIVTHVRVREAKVLQLIKEITKFRSRFSDAFQPARKLHDATVRKLRDRTVEDAMANLDIATPVTPMSRDARVSLGGAGALLKAACIALDDKFDAQSNLKEASLEGKVTLKGKPLDENTKEVLGCLLEHMEQCVAENLSKLAIEACLRYATLARQYQSARFENATTFVDNAKKLLSQAEKMCEQPFQGSADIRSAVEQSARLLGREWYESVSAEEIAAIKAAMISGSRGLATHSGHWYNCANGHPFAIGECGMPMQLARCPECGAQVGGQSHRPAEGVTRAMEME